MTAEELKNFMLYQLWASELPSDHQSAKAQTCAFYHTALQFQSACSFREGCEALDPMLACTECSQVIKLFSAGWFIQNNGVQD
jgi:hypothetical protein